MGRPENAPRSTIGTDARREARSRPSGKAGFLGLCLLGGGIAPILTLPAATVAQDLRQDPLSNSSLPTSLRPRVESLLRQGDTLEALDLLQDPAERLESDAWADSLLDALILPGDPQAFASRTRSAWVVRFDGGYVGNRHGSGTSSGTLLTDKVVRIQGDGISQSFRGGVRWHALRGETVSTTGIEPQVSWAGQAGDLAGLLRGWALWTPDLGNDAGFDAGLRAQIRPTLWTGLEGAFSMEAEQSVLVGAGMETRWGACNLTGSVRTGWKRLMALDPETSRIIRIDTIDGKNVLLNGDFLSPADVATLPGEAMESTTPDRWLLGSRILALWSWGDFQAGPGFEVEGVLSTRSERWLPDSRTTFPSGTPILVEASQPDRPVAFVAKQSGGYDLVPVPALRRGRVLSVLNSPSLHGAWRPRGRAWNIEGLLTWNLPFDSEPGHPLAEDREGPEARLASEVRW